MQKIQMSNGQIFLIDAEDYNKVMLRDKPWRGTLIRKWHTSKNGYVTSCVNGVQTYLHRLIMNPPYDKFVDHIDGNPLNNQKSNLRICDCSENNRNQIKNSRNTSGYKGVFLRCDKNKWCAKIKIRQKQINLGSFNTKEEAAIAYNQAAIKYHGEFALLNKISHPLE